MNEHFLSAEIMSSGKIPRGASGKFDPFLVDHKRSPADYTNDLHEHLMRLSLPKEIEFSETSPIFDDDDDGEVHKAEDSSTYPQDEPEVLLRREPFTQPVIVAPSIQYRTSLPVQARKQARAHRARHRVRRLRRALTAQSTPRPSEKGAEQTIFTEKPHMEGL